MLIKLHTKLFGSVTDVPTTSRLWYGAAARAFDVCVRVYEVCMCGLLKVFGVSRTSLGRCDITGRIETVYGGPRGNPPGVQRHSFVSKTAYM